jgi:hypothetical protein
VKQSFRTFVSRLPADGTLLAAVDHEGVRDVIAGAPCRVVGYGLETRGAGSWRASGIKADAHGTLFDVSRGGRFTARVRVPLFGRVNVENALAALATVDALGVPLEEAAVALAGFRGVKRRRRCAAKRGITVTTISRIPRPRATLDAAAIPAAAWSLPSSPAPTPAGVAPSATTRRPSGVGWAGTAVVSHVDLTSGWVTERRRRSWLATCSRDSADAIEGCHRRKTRHDAARRRRDRDEQ